MLHKDDIYWIYYWSFIRQWWKKAPTNWKNKQIGIKAEHGLHRWALSIESDCQGYCHWILVPKVIFPNRSTQILQLEIFETHRGHSCLFKATRVPIKYHHLVHFVSSVSVVLIKFLAIAHANSIDDTKANITILKIAYHAIVLALLPSLSYFICLLSHCFYF